MYKSEFYEVGNTFLKSLYIELSNELDDHNLFIDHLCYRVQNSNRYDELKYILSEWGELLISSPVGGREISTYKLYQPFEYEDHRVDILELPDIKNGSDYKEGFEHFEVVINEDFDQFISRHSQLDFITKDINKAVNPDIALKLKSGKVKFHHQSLEKVIELERKALS